MNNNVFKILFLALAATVVFLLFQNYELKKQIKEISSTTGTVSISPVSPETAAKNPAEISPFDQPNTDPLANQFPPETPSPDQLTSIQFHHTSHDFGRITEGTVANTEFKFTNTGKLPLLISKAEGSCGCTVPQWPRTPIQPGESAKITVAFDSHGKMGENEKTVTVVANTHPANSVLTIKSTVIPIDK